MQPAPGPNGCGPVLRSTRDHSIGDSQFSCELQHRDLARDEAVGAALDDKPTEVLCDDLAA